MGTTISLSATMGFRASIVRHLCKALFFLEAFPKKANRSLMSKTPYAATHDYLLQGLLQGESSATIRRRCSTMNTMYNILEMHARGR